MFFLVILIYDSLYRRFPLAPRLAGQFRGGGRLFFSFVVLPLGTTSGTNTSGTIKLVVLPLVQGRAEPLWWRGGPLKTPYWSGRAVISLVFFLAHEDMNAPKFEQN